MGSFDDAVAAHRNRVFTFAVYLVRDAAEAEDAVQEAFLRLWRNPRILRSDSTLPWLLRVTRNLCLDRLRANRSRRRIESCALEAIPEAADRAPGPETLASSSESGRRILAAISDLGEPARSIVVLREVQGLSYREIAEALDLGLNNVRVTLHRARRRLRASLREVVRHAEAS